MSSACGAPAFPSWLYTTFPKIVVEAKTFGLPQVCKLWLRVSKGMLPVKKEMQPRNSAACKHSMQYDRRPMAYCGTGLDVEHR